MCSDCNGSGRIHKVSGSIRQIEPCSCKRNTKAELEAWKAELQKKIDAAHVKLRKMKEGDG